MSHHELRFNKFHIKFQFKEAFLKVDQATLNPNTQLYKKFLYISFVDCINKIIDDTNILDKVTGEKGDVIKDDGNFFKV